MSLERRPTRRATPAGLLHECNESRMSHLETRYVYLTPFMMLKHMCCFFEAMNTACQVLCLAPGTHQLLTVVWVFSLSQCLVNKREEIAGARSQRQQVARLRRGCGGAMLAGGAAAGAALAHRLQPHLRRRLPGAGPLRLHARGGASQRARGPRGSGPGAAAPVGRAGRAGRPPIWRAPGVAPIDGASMHIAVVQGGSANAVARRVKISRGATGTCVLGP